MALSRSGVRLPYSPPSLHNAAPARRGSGADHRGLAAPMLETVRISAVLLLALGASARAQAVLDVLDGETLYDGGFLLTLGTEYERKESLWRGGHHIDDPAAGHEFATRSTLALQYGLRHDLQVGLAVPYATHDLLGSSGGSSTAGIGDLELLGKWRCYRWDAASKALNVALLAGLSLPTGADDVTRAGSRLDPELQPGS